jgi:aspartate aminotransferase
MGREARAGWLVPSPEVATVSTIAQESLYSSRVSLIDTENAFSVGPLISRVEKRGVRVIRCNIGEPDFPLPRHIAEEVKRQIDLDQTHYCDPQGVLPLREAVARQISESRGIDVTPDRVVVFPGAKPPIGFAQEAYCDPGDEVIYPSPGFPIYESFTRYVGAVPVPLHLEESSGFTLDPEELERAISPRTRLIFLNFPSNPTGGVASPELLEQIARIILDKAPASARVYSDEVYEKILFDGAVHHSIAAVPGMDERSIIVSGVSKTYCWTGGRVGWAVYPTADEAAVFRNLNINYFSCVSPYSQLGAAHAITSPESEPVIRTMVDSFEQRRNEIVGRLNAIDGVRCQTPGGAFYLFPNVSGLCERIGIGQAYDSLSLSDRQQTSPSTLLQRFLLDRYGLATMDRRSFGRIGSEGRHYLRLSIATALPDLIEATERIGIAGSDRIGFASFFRSGEWRS